MSLLLLNHCCILSEPLLKQNAANKINGVVGNKGTIIPITPMPVKVTPSIFHTGLPMPEIILFIFFISKS
jgi:hypothetical protein